MKISTPIHPTETRNFSDLGLEGHEFIHSGGSWSRCEDPEEFANYLEIEASRRTRFVDQTTRKGKPVEMTRSSKTPLEILTVTFAPWLSQWAFLELSAGRNPRPKLAAIRSRWLKLAEGHLKASRFLLGYALHADTDDLHFDLCVSRQDGLGGRIGQAGLGLVGPWCIGVDRQLRSGAEIAPLKRSQLTRSVKNFRHRYGESTIPLDVTLARDLDQVAEEEIGLPLTLLKLAYARSVPARESRNADAVEAALDQARERAKRLRPLNPISEDLDQLSL